MSSNDLRCHKCGAQHHPMDDCGKDKPTAPNNALVVEIAPPVLPIDLERALKTFHQYRSYTVTEIDMTQYVSKEYIAEVLDELEPQAYMEGDIQAVRNALLSPTPAQQREEE